MIYFLRAGDDGPVKIGTAIDPKKRIKEFQTASYTKLVVIRLIEGGLKEEKTLHRFFRRLRIQGEWFSYDDDMLVVDPSNISDSDMDDRLVMRRTASIRRTASMPPARFNECLKIRGWSVRYFAQRYLECDAAIPARWGRGTAPVPEIIAEWLEGMVEGMLANPPPTDWRTRPVREAAE